MRPPRTVLEQLIQDDGRLVVGAEDSLDTGVVEFTHGHAKPFVRSLNRVPAASAAVEAATEQGDAQPPPAVVAHPKEGESR